MESQNGMMIQITDMTEGATTCSRGAEVMEGIGSKEPHSFPGNLLETHHLQEERVQMDRVQFMAFKPDKGLQGK